MASDECISSFAAAELTPILHYYGMEILTMAKRINIAAWGLKHSKMDIEEFLKDTFKSSEQVILAPYHGGITYSLHSMPFEHLDQLVNFKPTMEASSIVGNHNREAYEALKQQYLNSSSDERDSCLILLKEFVLNSLLENLAANIHKGFASYFNPVDKQLLLLLDNRKVYSTDKTKIRSLELKCQKEEAARKKTEARAKLPSTASKDTPANQEDLPAKRKTRQDVSYREESGDSSSSVEYPVEGTHTDEEEEGLLSDSGQTTPILIPTSQLADTSNQSAIPPAYMTAPAASFMTSAPLNFKANIPKQKRRHSKKSSKKSAPSSDGDDNSKPSSNAERKKLEKKAAKKSSKKASKRHSKKSKKYSSSSSSSESDLEDSSPSEQVGSQPFIYLTITTTLTTYILLPWWWKVSLQSNCETRRL